MANLYARVKPRSGSQGYTVLRNLIIPVNCLRQIHTSKGTAAAWSGSNQIVVPVQTFASGPYGTDICAEPCIGIISRVGIEPDHIRDVAWFDGA